MQVDFLGEFLLFVKGIITTQINWDFYVRHDKINEDSYTEISIWKYYPLLMVQKSSQPDEVGSWNPIIYKVLYIPGGTGFLNYQQYYPRIIWVLDKPW